MVSLLDVAPATEKVSVAGKSVDVFGVSAKGLAVIMGRFPEVRQLFSGREVNLTPDDIIRLAPEAIAAIIAAGVGQPGEAEYEAVAEKMTIEIQLRFIEAIVKMTMPNGLNPFVERLRGLGLLIGLDLNQAGAADASGKALVGKSPKQ